MIRRQAFNISTDTGTQGDTGAPMNGTIRALRWSPTTADTGADLYVALINAQGDTAGGMQILADSDCLGTAFTKQPTLPQTHVDGFDTGASLDVPFVAAGERLRVKVTPAGAAVAGKLYAYIED
jgi:hypothetical protein